MRQTGPAFDLLAATVLLCGIVFALVQSCDCESQRTHYRLSTPPESLYRPHDAIEPTAPEVDTWMINPANPLSPLSPLNPMYQPSYNGGFRP